MKSKIPIMLILATLIIFFVSITSIVEAGIFRDRFMSINDDGSDEYGLTNEDYVGLYDDLIAEQNQPECSPIKGQFGGCVEMLGLGIVVTPTGDEFITWNQDTNAGYEITGAQGITQNTVIDPLTEAPNTALGNIYTKRLFAAIANDSLIDIIDGANEIGFITVGKSALYIYNMTFGEGSIFGKSFLSGEYLISNAIIFNPYNDTADKLIFATNRYIYVYNISRQTNFNQVANYSIISYTSQTKNAQIGCLNPYNKEGMVECRFYGIPDMTSELIYYPLTNTLNETDGFFMQNLMAFEYNSYPIVPSTYQSTYFNEGAGNVYELYPSGYSSTVGYTIYHINQNGVHQFTSFAANNGYTKSVNAVPSRAGSGVTPIVAFSLNYYDYGLSKLIEYRRIYSYNLATIYTALDTNDNYRYSDWFVGEYTNSGVKKLCIFRHRISQNDTYLYCWNSISIGIDINSGSTNYSYPSDLDIEQNDLIMGNFANNGTNMCFGSYQGIVCENSNGGWITKNSEINSASKWETPRSSAIVIEHGKPALFAFQPQNNVGNVYMYYDSLNGLLGDNLDKAFYAAQGLIWYNDFGYYANNRSVINIVNTSQTGVAINSPIFNSTGIIFNGINQTMQLPHVNVTGDFTIHARLFINKLNPHNMDGIGMMQNGGDFNFYGGHLYWFNSSTNVFKSDQTFNPFTWYTIDIRRNTSKVEIFINGLKDTNYSNTGGGNIEMISLGNTSAGFATEFFSDFRIWNRALTNSEINGSAPLVSDGYCTLNSECDSRYPYCVNGCCVNGYDNSSVGLNQCDNDLDCSANGFEFCALALNKSFSIRTCVNDYQSYQCYVDQITYGYGGCPQGLIDYYSVSEPLDTCQTRGTGVCVQDTNVACSASCTGDPTFDCLNSWDHTTNRILHCNTKTHGMCYWSETFNECKNLDCTDFDLDRDSCTYAGCTYHNASENCQNFSNGYYYCSGGNIFQVSCPSGDTSCIHQGLYCELSGDVLNPSFRQCTGNTSCFDGSCQNLACTPSFQVCSNGISFSVPDSSGDVYQCNEQGTGFLKIDDCGVNETCNEATNTYAYCQSSFTFYCNSNGRCTWLNKDDPSVPYNCYTTLSECENAITYGAVSSADQGELRNIFNLFLGTSGFGKLLAAMIFIIFFIIGGYVLIAHYSPPGTHINPLIPLIFGLCGFVMDVLVGLIPMWTLIILILGTIAIVLLMRFLINPVGSQ